MKRTLREKAAISAQGAVILAALVAILLWNWYWSPLGWLAPIPSPHLSLEEATQAAWKNARLRYALEFAVVVFQVGGVATLCLSRLMPAAAWADRSRIAFGGALVGLGVAGILCAWHGSEFALFSGGTMAVLLNLGILGSGASHATQPTEHAPIFMPQDV
jgi:hypothetical protein